MNASRYFIATVAAMACAVGSAVAQMPGAGSPGPLTVGTITLNHEAVPMRLTLSGLAVASQDAEIRPLVQGILQEILYQPDQQMKVGDPMFRIDPTSYRAAVAVAKANLASAEAAVPAAEANVKRYQELAGRSVTEADVESVRTTLEQAQAAVAQAQANLQAAQYNLDNTTITSPIEGRAAVPNVSVGNLVTAGQSSALTTVTRLDPIYADLVDTSARMLEIRQMLDRGVLTPGKKLTVTLTLENGETLAGEGEVISVGNRVSTSTGTFNVRVKIANPERRVLPGMFVTAEIGFGNYQAVLVPQMAGSPRADGTLRIFVVEDGKAQERYVVAVDTTDSAWVVTQGIEDGAQLIVDNLDNIRAGAEVKTVAVQVGAGGVVTDLAPTPDIKPNTAPNTAQ